MEAGEAALREEADDAAEVGESIAEVGADPHVCAIRGHRAPRGDDGGVAQRAQGAEAGFRRGPGQARTGRAGRRGARRPESRARR